MAMASTSSTSTPPQTTYDVFLSFRGEDTGTSFTDHLYTALHDKGIFTFRYDEQLARGKPISPEVFKAIEKSRFSIVILSRNYASSAWCLDETAKIVQCMNKTGQIVLPVFYRVDPSQVRNQTGDFAHYFAQHEHFFKENTEKVKKWRDALTQIANIYGWEIKERYESIVIQDIVEHILDKLNRTISSFPKDLVGMDSRFKEVESELGIGLQDIRVIGILGIAGIGKTTIAEVIFERIRDQFEASSFIANIRDKYAENHGLVQMQEQLCNDLLKSKVTIQSVNKGLNVIRRRLRYKKVVIILDDIDQLEQIEALAGHGEKLYDWFGPGSRIIITTRDEHLLKTYGANNIYQVKKLTEDEALLLFCQKAFKKDHPMDDYVDLSYKFVDYSDGLPLAVEVLGSFLFDRSFIEWSSAFDSLKDYPNKKIHHAFKISFDGLETLEEKKIFLDIACFFKGEDVKRVKRIFESCGYYPDISIRLLLDKSLVSIIGGRLWMHDLLQEMGKEIVRGESQEEPGKRSRLWHNTDALGVLADNKGTAAVEGIFLNSPQPDNAQLLADPFLQMYKLRLLKIHNVRFCGCLGSLPNELRFLDWHGYPLKSLPSSFKLNKLVELNMSGSQIEQLWKEIRRPLEKLVTINLTDCEYLTLTPDFNAVPKLESLILKGCKRLYEVHPSIGVLQQLIVLNLKGCESLGSLPHNINLRSLTICILSGCSKLKKFPEIGGNMKQLSELHLDGTAIKELPTSIKHLSGLIMLNLRDCKNLLSLAGDICTLTSLQFLNLSGCSKLDELPENIGSLECLQVLDGSRSAIRQVPSSILLLRKLKLLSFAACRAVPHNSWCSLFSCCLLPSASSVGLQLPSSFSGLCSLRILNLSDCNLSEGAIPEDLGCLSSLQHLNLSGNNFMNIPENICQLSQLEDLQLSNCSKLQSLPTLPSSIRAVNAQDCPVQGTYSNRSIWCTSTTAGYCLINCQKSDEEQKMHRLPLTGLLTLPFIQTYCEDIISHHEGFQFTFSGQTEIPAWFSRQTTGLSIRIPLPPDLDGNSKWMGLAICFVCEEEWDNLDSTWYYNGRDNKDSIKDSCYYQCHLYTNEDPLESPLVIKLMDRHTSDGSYGHWVYAPRGVFTERLINKRFIRASIIMDSPRVKVKACGAHLIYLEDVPEFVRILTCTAGPGTFDQSNLQEQEVTSSELTHVAEHGYTSETRFLIPIEPHTKRASTKLVGQLRRNVESVIAELFKGCYARRYDYGFILSLRAILPWFSHQSIGRKAKLSLPPNLYNDKKWVGFSLFVAFTLPPDVQQIHDFCCYLSTGTRDVEHFVTVVYREDNLVGSDRLCVIHVPRRRFPELLNQCSSLFSSFSFGIPGVEVEMCGIRIVYHQDLKGLIQTVTQCTISSPPVFYQRDDETVVVEVKGPRYFAFLKMAESLLEEAKSSEGSPVQRRVSSEGRVISKDSTSTVGQIIHLHIPAETPFREGYSVIEWKGNLEYFLQCLFAHSLSLCVSLTLRGEQAHILYDFDADSIYESCFHQKEIPEWFREESRTCWVMSSIPPNLGSDNNWMGVVICAAFSVNENPNAVLNHLGSELSHKLTCQFQISTEGCLAKSVSCHIFENLLMWLYLQGFIWLLYIPRQHFTGSLNGQGHLIASIMSDSPSLAVQKCSLRLLYKQDEDELKHTIIHCFTSLFDNENLIRGFDRYLIYGSCFPPNEILKLFEAHESSGPSVTIPLPPNRHRDGNWTGLAFFAHFSVLDEHQSANLDNLHIQGFSQQLMCKLESDRGSIEPGLHAYCTTNQELEWLSQLGGFIWVSHIPRVCFLEDQLNECSLLRASFGSDCPGLNVHKCGIRLLHQHDEEEFKETIRHCMASLYCDVDGKAGSSDTTGNYHIEELHHERPIVDVDSKGKRVLE